MEDPNIISKTFKFAIAHMNKLLLHIKKRKDTPNRTPTEQCKKKVIHKKQTAEKTDKIQNG